MMGLFVVKGVGVRSQVITSRVETATATKVALIARRLGLTENSLTRRVLRALTVGPDGRLHLLPDGDAERGEQAADRPA